MKMTDKQEEETKLDIASRLLRRKIPQTGHLMLPRRLWMQTVPTQGCEVVLSFTAAADDAAVSWLAGRLRARLPELLLSVRSTPAAARAIHLAATMDGLVKGAEDLRLFKRTKAEFGRGLREVTTTELSIFEGVEEQTTFFSSQERHAIVLYLLDSLRATEEDEGSAVPLRLGEAIVSKWRSAGLIEQVFPLHDREHLARLQNSWVQTFFRYQPLDSIHDYFGDKIAVYFAWLGFYTASLIFPAVIGLVFWLQFWGRDQATEDAAFVLLALFNVVWGSVWLEAWKRRSSELVHRWGLPSDLHELLEEPRPQFKGELHTSPVTGRLEPRFPTWRRNVFRYCVTLPLVVLCLLAVFMVMLLILKLQDLWDDWLEVKGLPGFLSWGPKMMMALTISFFDEAYTRVAVWLNDNENYRTDEMYHNYLIVKLGLFRFVNSFLALFYIAFYLQDMERLKEQLAALLLMRQIVGNIKESCVPYFMEQLRLAKLSFDLFGALSPTQEERTWPQEGGGEIQRLLQKEESKGEENNTDVRRRHVGSSSPSSAHSAAPPSPVPAEGGATAGPPHSGASSNGPDTTASPCPASCHADGGVGERSGDPTELMRSMSRSRIVSQADVESNMQRYDGTFEDYLEMLIQFGYVMLFSSAFPLAAICAFLNNIIEIRSDAFKLCCVFQRPFPQRVGSIGVWQDAMELLGLLGIVVNCMLIGQSGQVHRMFPEMTTTQTILLVVVLEHAMIALKYSISHAITDVPEWVMQEQAKAEFRRREALRRISTVNSPPTRETSQPPSPRLSSFSGGSADSTDATAAATNAEVAKIKVIPEVKPEVNTVKSSRAHEIQLLKKFSIPEFSAIKRSGTPESPSARKGSSQDQASKKAPVSVEAVASKNITTPERATPKKIPATEHTSDRRTVSEGRTSAEQVEEMPHFGTGRKIIRSTSSSSTGDKGKNSLEKNPHNAQEHTEKTHHHHHHHHEEKTPPHVNETSPLFSAPPHVDQNKEQFSFAPEDQKRLTEEKQSHPDRKGSGGSSSTHSVTSPAESPAQPLKEHIMQSHPTLFHHHHDKHKEGISLLHHAFSSKRTYSSIECLPQDLSCSPPSDGIAMTDPSLPKTDTLRRKPPNKFLKRAQSFSQFLKKMPVHHHVHHERRKRSGDGSRDDYYLPVNQEQLEEPQGEMMLVPVEKLVSIADLTHDRSD